MESKIEGDNGRRNIFIDTQLLDVHRVDDEIVAMRPVTFWWSGAAVRSGPEIRTAVKRPGR